MIPIPSNVRNTGENDAYLSIIQHNMLILRDSIIVHIDHDSCHHRCLSNHCNNWFMLDGHELVKENVCLLITINSD